MHATRRTATHHMHTHGRARTHGSGSGGGGAPFGGSLSFKSAQLEQLEAKQQRRREDEMVPDGPTATPDAK